jgi:predicted GTPase
VTRDDERIARMLRSGRFGRGRGTAGPGAADRVRVVATKVDGPKWEAHAHELAALGFGPPLMLSAKSNYFRREFLDALWGMLPEPDDEPRPRADLHLAVIGKRNAGKSSLVNRLAGEPRVIVSEIAGTTRDAVDVLVELDGRTVMLIDTAGLRKKKSFHGPSSGTPSTGPSGPSTGPTPSCCSSTRPSPSARSISSWPCSPRRPTSPS